MYKFFFNFYLKKQGYNNHLYILAGMTTSLFILCIPISFFAIIGFIIDYPFTFNIQKPISLLITTTLFILCHQIMFKILKFKKIGDRPDYSFSGKEKHAIVWILLIISIIIPTILIIIQKS